MISFMISVVPPKIDRLDGKSHRTHDRGGDSADWYSCPSRRALSWSARAAAFAWCDLGGDHSPWDRLAALQLPEPRRGPDDHTEPAAADIPAPGADVDTSERIAAKLPQVLLMHDASPGSRVRPCCRATIRISPRVRTLTTTAWARTVADEHRVGEGR